jgi:hypothetical protein
MSEWDQFKRAEPEPAQANQWEQFPKAKTPPGVGERLRQADEYNPIRGLFGGIGSVAQSIPAAAGAGLYGIWQAAGNGPPGAGAQGVEDAMRVLSPPADTAFGRGTASAISFLPGLIGEGIDWAGRGMTTNLSRLGASPEGAAGAGTAANVGLNLITMLLGGTMGRKAAPGPRPPSAIADALDAGFKLTPTQLERGLPLTAIEGLAGSPKMEIGASIKNQRNFNRIVSEDFGITGRPMKESDFATIRQKAGQAYEEVKSGTNVKLVKPDAQFQRDLADLRGDFTKAANEYPELMTNDAVETLIGALNKPASPAAMVELTKKLRKDATSNLKSFDDPAKRELGMAQRGAATALEDMIERGLTSVGKPDLVSKWREARTQIAKSYDAESAFNPTTGNFDMPTLARMHKQGRPFTGGMKTAAEFARAFEGSARSVDKMKGSKNEFGYGDALLGTLAAAGSHAAGLGLGAGAGLGLVLARPTARQIMLSKPFQNQGIRLDQLGALADKSGRGLMAAPAMGLRMPQEQEEY